MLLPTPSGHPGPKAFRRFLLPALGTGLLLGGLAAAGLVPERSSPSPAAEPARPALELPIHRSEPVLPLPDLPALDEEKVALGRLLFHDKRLSADNSVSCASCHPLERGGADGRAVSVGIGGAQGELNAPSVLTAALNFRQFWDGRAATLEEQAAGPITHPKEMGSSWPQVIARLGGDRAMLASFQHLYPDGLTPANVAGALADFERSLPRPSRFDRWLKGDLNAISNEEQAGYILFKKHGCVGCHQGANLGGNLFQRFGVMSYYFNTKAAVTRADLGRYNITGQDEDRHVFKVPTLRNVALTAPYFHDGSAATLEKAVSIMGRYQLGIDLPPRDVALIVAFLKTLNEEAAP